MAKLSSFSKFIGIWSIMTGIFAMVGALYTWGAGVIFTVPSPHLPTIVTDLLLTAPMGVILGFAILGRKTWSKQLSLMFAGILIYGSVAVYATELVVGPPYNILLFFPPIFGMIQSVFLIAWSLNKKFHPTLERSQMGTSYPLIDT